MKLENLAKKTRWLPKIGKAIRDFYGSRPPYVGLTYVMMSFTYLVNETGIGIEKIKSRISR